MRRIEDTAARKKVPSPVTGVDEDGESLQSRTEPTPPKVYLYEEGRLKPFSPGEYTRATLYQVVETFTVESKLVRPEESGTLAYEGKRPSKKTVPIVINKEGECLLPESWEALESRPEDLAHAVEVFGANPVRQVFVLRRKEE
ncbi:MAG TPA: hypothetical protein PLM79_08325 [Syntrophobacteraceae bacterium]|nr:hypothetical protein [Syntrophobacteraceae bacterium]